MNRKKLVIVVDRINLKDYGFFYHEASHCWWNVLRTSKGDKSNVELSLRLYDDNDELRLHATNDHMKLPSLYNPKYDKNNYLELEEELDKFSFDEWTQLGVVFDLIKGGIVDYKKYEYKRVNKRINNVIDKLDDKRRKENKVRDGIDELVDLIVGNKSIDTPKE
jgi:hypothetical protein